MNSSSAGGGGGFLSWTKEISRKQWLTFGAAFGGWTLDAFDLLLYIYALPSIRDTFNLTDAQAAWLFGVTLASSAIGGAMFGIISDYIGRIRALTLSILMYSVFTGLSAFAPNVEFFLVCRFFLGLGMGGEWASGEVLVAESWPKEHRGKVIGMVQSGWGVGYILAAIISIVVLPHAEFKFTLPALGEIHFHSWRTLFLIGILPAFLIFYVRRHCEEPEVWRTTARLRKEKKLSDRAHSFTLKQIFHPDLLRYTITATLLTSFCMIAYWGLNTWIPTYLASPIERGGAGLGLVRGYSWTIIINIGAFLGTVTFGMISDRFGRRPVFVGYLLITAVLVPLFGSVDKIHQMLAGVPVEMVLFVLCPLLGFFGTGFYAGFGAIMSEIFPTSARGTAQGFAYNVGRGASAIAPALFATVAGMTLDGHRVGYGLSLMTASFFAVLGALTILTLPETRGKALEVE